jgi:hypothetical protein
MSAPGVGAGMAGGSGVPTAGGLLVKGAVYGIVRLTPDLGLSLEAGLTSAPRGDVRAAQASAGLVWALDGPRQRRPAALPARTDLGFGVWNASRRRGATAAAASCRPVCCG